MYLIILLAMLSISLYVSQNIIRALSATAKPSDLVKLVYCIYSNATMCIVSSSVRETHVNISGKVKYLLQIGDMVAIADNVTTLNYAQDGTSIIYVVWNSTGNLNIKIFRIG